MGIIRQTYRQFLKFFMVSDGRHCWRIIFKASENETVLHYIILHYTRFKMFFIPCRLAYISSRVKSDIVRFSTSRRAFSQFDHITRVPIVHYII